jgi:hypothetical protein
MAMKARPTMNEERAALRITRRDVPFARRRADSHTAAAEHDEHAEEEDDRLSSSIGAGAHEAAGSRGPDEVDEADPGNGMQGGS